MKLLTLQLDELFKVDDFKGMAALLVAELKLGPVTGDVMCLVDTEAGCTWQEIRIVQNSSRYTYYRNGNVIRLPRSFGAHHNFAEIWD